MKKLIWPVKYLIIILFYFLLIETLSRAFVWQITDNTTAFSFGFNKNIQINIFHIRKLDIKIEDLGLIKITTEKNFLNKKKENIQDKNEIIIWTFGGSTTRGGQCGGKSSTWQKQLNKINNNIKIKNLGENGINSDKSLYLFKNEIIKNKSPDIIIWGNKFNEINVIYQGLRGNKEKINHSFPNLTRNKFAIFFMKIDKTFKSNFVSYKLLDDLILRISRKLMKSNEPGLLSENVTSDDLKFASLNYKINTDEAIKLSKKNGINEFIILSLPARKDYTKLMQKKFFGYYEKRITELINEHNVQLIDLSSIKGENKKLFCDYAHKTLEGNKLVAKTIYEFLEENSKFFH